MTTIRDISKKLAAKHLLTNAEAEVFIQMMVEVINEGLLRDRLVKIKGFGTFKLQTMKERASVNVNTGERVLISEHDKVSFTPDSIMKDLINKPFAQFDTVMVDNDSPLLNENIELDIINEEIENTNVQEENGDVLVSKGSIEGDNSINYTTQTENQTVKSPVHIVELPKQTSQQMESKDATESTEEPSNDCDSPRQHCHNIFVYYGIIINIVVASLAFALGYVAGKQQWLPFKNSSKKENYDKNIHQDNNSARPQSKIIDSVQYAKDTSGIKVDVVKQTKVLLQENSERKSAKPQDVPLTEYDSDVRVRTGAYYIIGTDKEVTVSEGQTLKSISRAHLGDGMECYVEAYNGKTTVKTGDKIKIPKLKLKKLGKNS